MDNNKKTFLQTTIQLSNLKKNKGSMCSVEGSKYEKKVHTIVKHCYLNNRLFNTQKEYELGGSSINNDIQCNFNTKNNIGIEIKKYKAPDWMQCSLKYNNKTLSWEANKRSKIPPKCREMFNKLIININLYNGEIPPFMKKTITHEKWLKIKSETTKWNDISLNIPSDYIAKLYYNKGCNYIQISNGYGLYHLGYDICNFGVPLFTIEQELRIRTKIHRRKNKKGFCQISVTAACKPKKITNLQKSNYSLDDKCKLPLSLIYKERVADSPFEKNLRRLSSICTKSQSKIKAKL